MATVVRSSSGQLLLYVKRCSRVSSGYRQRRQVVSTEAIEKRLYEYQSQAMRTLGFACQLLDTLEGIADED